MTNIHTVLKELRIEKGLTQEEVADKIGLTRQAISGYESEKRQPGIDILVKLAEIYEVNVETVLYGKLSCDVLCCRTHIASGSSDLLVGTGTTKAFLGDIHNNNPLCCSK